MRLTFEIGEVSEPDVDEFILSARTSGIIASYNEPGAITLDVFTDRIEVEE